MLFIIFISYFSQPTRHLLSSESLRKSSSKTDRFPNGWECALGTPFGKSSKEQFFFISIGDKFLFSIDTKSILIPISQSPAPVSGRYLPNREVSKTDCSCSLVGFSIKLHTPCIILCCILVANSNLAFSTKVL